MFGVKALSARVEQLAKQVEQEMDIDELAERIVAKVMAGIRKEIAKAKRPASRAKKNS